MEDIKEILLVIVIIVWSMIFIDIQIRVNDLSENWTYEVNYGQDQKYENSSKWTTKN